jgi:anthranilate synthase/aminodeoxychorismate synthase-like glutamine amidotransferase
MILLIDNYDSFTWNLVQRLGELDPSLEPGRDLLVVRNDRITPEQAAALDGGRGPTHLVISPGPCTPAEAGVSRAMIAAFAGRIPILGVCLGHQCIGAESGMTVARHHVPVHGKTSLVHHDGKGVFKGIPSPFEAARYHSLVVLPESVPGGRPTPGAGSESRPTSDGWEISAWSDEDGPDGSPVRVVMGLRRVWADPGKAPLEGVQFHPESFLTEEGPRLLANFLGMGVAGAVGAGH